MIRWLPRNFVGRGALVGLICMFTAALLWAGGLGALGFDSMTRTQITVHKALYTTLLGLIVTPLFAWRALADEAAAPAVSTNGAPAPADPAK